jgi:hypothetical protein
MADDATWSDFFRSLLEALVALALVALFLSLPVVA